MKSAMSPTKSITFVLLCIAALLLLSAPSANAALLRSSQMIDQNDKNAEDGSVLLPPELIDTMVGKALADQGLSIEDFLFDEAWEWSDLNYTAEEEEDINFINDGLPEGMDLNDYNLTFVDEVTGEVTQDHRLLGVSVSSNEFNNARYVNSERVKRKIKGLSWKVDSIREAQKWSRYMCSSGVFKHRTKLAAGIGGNWRRISENIAMNMKVSFSGAHTALMKSTGHRENILDGKVNTFGIGICRNRKGWYYVTQIFAQIA